MTIDTDKTLELLHNSPCSFSYNTNPPRYTIEQKELVKFVNFIYGKAIDDCINIVKFYRDSWDGIEWAIRDIEELKEMERDEE